jgi:hypothetical protein
MAPSRLIDWPQILLPPIIFLIALRPGDAPWVNDESILMEMAIRYNHTPSHLYGFSLPFTPCPFGLEGTHGARYGPPPVWLDQIFLTFTHDLILMLAMRTVLFAAMTALALLWLARTLRLSSWFAVITMLSPWIWLFSRSLWDSTWCIPCSAMLFASYAAFLVKPRPASLITAVICCIVLPLIHLMGLAMTVPVLIHLLVFHRAQIRVWGWRIAAAVAVCIYLFYPYLYFLFHHLHPDTFPDQSPMLGWFFPLFGGHFLTLGVAGTMPGDGWQDYAPAALRILVEIVQWITRPALAMVWVGMALGIPRAVLAVRRRGNPVDHLCLIALLVWIGQTLLDGFGRVYFAPHYYSGTWMAYIFLA